MLRGRLVVAGLALGAALGTAGIASAKEGVKATLTSPVRLGAAPGTTLHVTWTLSYTDHGTRQPFGAGGVFVRLRSASGAAQTGMAHGDGSYAADVVVPQGGIADVQIGLEGFTESGPAPVLFPIANDPLPGTLPVRGAVAGRAVSSGWDAWPVAGVAALAVVALAASRRLRRYRASTVARPRASTR
jgi:hypothetical protein